MTDPWTYVWFRGRCWLNTGMRDDRGRLHLWSLRDSSAGVLADPKKVTATTEAESKVLDAWRRGEIP